MRLALLALALAMGPSSSSAQIAGIISLNTLRDRARPLLIFAPKPDDPRLEIQIRILTEHAAEAHDRDLVLIALPYNNPSPADSQLTPNEAQEARRRFHVAPGDFAVVLIGKDGRSKLRTDKPLSMETLNSTIDAMPMRQEEMRAGRRKP